MLVGSAFELCRHYLSLEIRQLGSYAVIFEFKNITSEVTIEKYEEATLELPQGGKK